MSVSTVEELSNQKNRNRPEGTKYVCMAAILHKKGQLHGSYNLGLSSMPVELYQRPFHFVSSPTGEEVIQVQIPPLPPKKSSQSNVINGVLPETDKQSYQQCLQATKRHSFSHFQLH